MSKKNVKRSVVKVVRYRDAKTGQFTTEAYASRHRRTTVRENGFAVLPPLTEKTAARSRNR